VSADERSEAGEITLRYWAALRSAAGLAAERVPAGSLASALDTARGRHGDRFVQVVGLCSVLVDEQPVGSRDAAAVDLPPGAVVDLLPPFAGG